MDNFLITFTQKKKSPSEFLVEKRVKSSKQRAKSNKQRAKTNEQQAKTNEQRAKSFTSQGKAKKFYNSVGQMK